ncbi:MAG: hypothetical protein ACRDZ0_09020 [Acidimicrobiales bacterium]
MPNADTPDACARSPRRLLGLELYQVAKACDQLAPERARSCRNAITMASVMVDEIRLRAHARPLDSDEE